MANVTIIGGHGKVALLAEPMLRERGHTVNAIIRSEDQSADIMATGANPVVADITTLSTEEMAKLFKDLHTEVLVWSAGAGGVGGPERTYAIDRDAAIRSMEAAQQAGIRRYIMVSYLGAGTEHGVPADNPFFAYAEAKAEADQHLRGTRLEYTILGPACSRPRMKAVLPWGSIRCT
ncbi:MAG: NAD(P)H-binding protein, partial [Rothia dentocariosa]